MNKPNRDRIASVAVTVCVHAILLLILFFTVFGHPEVIEEELGGVLVQTGLVDEAKGTFEPDATEQPVTSAKMEPQPQPKPPSDDDMVTQDDEETVRLAQEKKKKDEAKKEEQEERQKKEQLAREKRQKEEAEQRKVDNLIAGKFKSTKNQDNRGDGNTGSGVQGSVNGNSNTGKTTGVGGYGDYYDLEGRSIGKEGLPRPSINAQETGTVVVSIIVNPQGQVIKTEVARGTTITDLAIRRAALSAASRARFNTVAAKNNQSGTIIYRFVVG